MLSLPFKLAKLFWRPMALHILKWLFVPSKPSRFKEVNRMKNKVRGGAFRLTGLILGIIGATVSITAIVFSAVGLHQSHLCKKCDKGAAFK